MKEYGGYIEFEYFHSEEYHKDAVALNSGRHCVEYLIRARGIKKILLPYFMCDSIYNTCCKMGIEVNYYHIGIDLQPVPNLKLQENEWLYLVNYYGQFSDEKIRKMKSQYHNLILDNVQAFFQMPVEGVDTLYSCRKFFGVADGAYLYTDKLLSDRLEQDCSGKRMSFLFGRMEESANEYYPEYVSNNDRLDDEVLKLMSKTTRNILCGLDYEQIRKVRTENFKYLHDHLAKVNRLNLFVPQGAFMYPLYIEHGAELRKKLQQEKIYIPTLWPDVFRVCDNTYLEHDMALNILPLPVDQRYSKDDMNYILKQIKESETSV